tara:strand:- start:81 stop:611 length:531 start_codon:yes stop_codon:yes gene_type:complete
MSKKSDPELYYLVNPIYSKKITNKVESTPVKMEDVSKKEKVFYKKRIQQLTRDCMSNKAPNTLVRSAYNDYVKTCIEYFKQEDTNELMQNEYDNLIINNEEIIEDIDINALDENLYNKKQEKTIEDYIPLKKKVLVPEDPPIYPKQKTLNIKDNKFKTKGVKDKKNKKIKKNKNES